MSSTVPSKGQGPTPQVQPKAPVPGPAPPASKPSGSQSIPSGNAPAKAPAQPSAPAQVLRPVGSDNSLASLVSLASTVSVQSAPEWYLPTQFNLPGDKQFYYIDTAHRGDMYHIRAARAIKPLPVLVYNYEVPKTSGAPAAAPAPASGASSAVSLPAPAPALPQPRKFNELEAYLSDSKSFSYGRTTSAKMLFPKIDDAAKKNGKFFEVYNNGVMEEPKADQWVTFQALPKFIDEGASTEVIVNAIKQAQKQDEDSKQDNVALQKILDTMYAGMTSIKSLVSSEVSSAIDKMIIEVLDARFKLDGAAAAVSKDCVLIMYRDSGCKVGNVAYQKGAAARKASRADRGVGVYPENDTDEKTCIQLAAAIASAKWKNGKPARAVLCGNAEGSLSAVASIHQYFLDFKLDGKGAAFAKHKDLEAIIKQVGISSRDLDTRFMQLAYQLQYIRMVVGMRSGALDLCTFIGIPTVSIQLDKLKGAERMNWLGPEMSIKNQTDKSDVLNAAFGSKKVNPFKRLNINYSTARHTATRLMPSTHKDPKLSGVMTQMSPFWDSGFDRTKLPQQDQDLFNEKVQGAGDIKKRLHSTPPGPFMPDDQKLVEGMIHTFMASDWFA